MKFFFCTIISFFSYCAISQNNTVLLEGTVTMDDEKDPVENAIIHLKLSSGTMLEEKTDVFGKYKFIVKDTTSNFSITLVTDKSTRSLSRSSSCFFATKDEGKGTLKANTNFVKDFQLVKVLDCGMHMPTILFYKNSLSCCNDSLHKFKPTNYETFENATNMLYQTLKDNPTISIELAGHASMEENKPDKLSKQRANTIKRALVSKGINKKRIQTKGWGTEKPLFKTEQIEKAIREEEKAVLHLKNQRVVFRIISWDFVEEKK